MSDPKFQVGDDLFVRDPARFIEGVTCITGEVQSVSQGSAGWAYTLAAHIGKVGGWTNPPEGQALRFSEADLGLRLGTPISQLSGRPGHRGYDQFKEIAASWGHD